MSRIEVIFSVQVTIDFEFLLETMDVTYPKLDDYHLGLYLKIPESVQLQNIGDNNNLHLYRFESVCYNELNKLINVLEQTQFITEDSDTSRYVHFEVNGIIQNNIYEGLVLDNNLSISINKALMLTVWNQELVRKLIGFGRSNDLILLKTSEGNMKIFNYGNTEVLPRRILEIFKDNINRSLFLGNCEE